MGNVYKRPQVIRDLIDLATYIAANNMDVSDKFLAASIIEGLSSDFGVIAVSHHEFFCYLAHLRITTSQSSQGSRICLT